MNKTIIAIVILLSIIVGGGFLMIAKAIDRNTEMSYQLTYPRCEYEDFGNGLGVRKNAPCYHIAY